MRHFSVLISVQMVFLCLQVPLPGSHKPGFHIIAPIVSKNLPAIGAIIWKSLDRFDRSKRALTQLRSLNLSTFFGRETVSKWRQEITDRAGLAAIYFTILTVIRRRRRKHQPEADLTFFFFKNLPYAVQIFLYFFSASAASILKISPIFFQQF